MSSSIVAPNNAVLANAVAAKDLTNTKKHLEHVPIEKAPHTLTGGVHLGPGKGQADFAPNTIVQSTHTSALGSVSKGGNHVVESAHSGEVSVQSSVTIDTVQQVDNKAGPQIQALLTRLSTTTSQVDDYSRRANEKISAEANRLIQQCIAETQREQDALLRDASARSLEIESEYSAKLKEFLQGLDASKASNLASLEKDLVFRQEQLLSNARDEMDRIHRNATQQKIGVMESANRSVLGDVDRLTEQVKVLGEAEVERRMNSTTTTIIKTVTETEHAAEAATHTLPEKDRALVTDKTEIRRTEVISEPRTHTATRI